MRPLFPRSIRLARLCCTRCSWAGANGTREGILRSIPSGNAYVFGDTNSPDFDLGTPATNIVLQHLF